MKTVFSLLFLILLAGCSGIMLYQPPNHREEGPQQGLFTGEKGAFEIGILPESNRPLRQKEETR
ncbi:hypothetical protein [Trichlorobacter lovleyi]|uniref:Lipoprotein n=1 Tax=Trichlorobacter lovleyi (strain ATCC BAA-1151 / DSM 17278 / SZ) TaxID=398767 RepID=B3E5C4_TRIL1|nr:hypothetical protein [Trichlorobacter lovleyi]ACD96111.1 hypothetical protein Glov_2395 [Trichlorobacter lovleyi SZ]